MASAGASGAGAKRSEAGLAVSATDEDKFHSSCPVQCRRWVSRRIPCLCCLFAPSLLLIVCAKAGLRRPSPRASNVLVGLPFRRHETRSEIGPPPNSSCIIPWQFFTTGKAASLGELHGSVRGNIEHTLALNPGMKVQYFSDEDCHAYIRTHFDSELASYYRKETAGHFRGDMCRAAVLFREGGFYTDVDLEVKAPFLDMVDGTTTFMSVFTADGAILNAMIATLPGSAILDGTLQEMRRWYKGTEGSQAPEEHGEGEWMGTVTLRRGMESFMKANCPNESLTSRRFEQKLQWTCGRYVMRFYQEDRLECAGDEKECPEVRSMSEFEGLKFGIFVPGTREVVAWPRVATCTDWWCGGR